jgi:hypothetical protein
MRRLLKGIHRRAIYLKKFSACAYICFPTYVELTLSTLRANSAMNVACTERVVVLDSFASWSKVSYSGSRHTQSRDTFSQKALYSSFRSYPRLYDVATSYLSPLSTCGCTSLRESPNSTDAVDRFINAVQALTRFESLLLAIVLAKTEIRKPQ